MIDRRICFFNINKICSENTGGIRRFIELYQYALSSEKSVDLYATDTQKEFTEKGFQGKTLICGGRSLIKIPSYEIYQSNRDLLKAIKNEKYDEIIAFDVPSVFVLTFNGIKKVNFFIRQDFIAYRLIEYSNMGMNKWNMWLRLLLGWMMESICIRRSDRIISQCKYDLEALKKRHPLLTRRIENISAIQINNINPSWIEKDKYSLSDNIEKEYDIIYVGNFDDSRKGHDLLLTAVESLFDKGYMYKVLMVGGGDHLKEYQDKYNGIVTFTGKADRPSKYIVKSRLMIVPSHADSCPNTVLEALYYNVPVIGSRIGGIPEILNNPDWTFELNVESLLKKIHEILGQNRLNEIKEGQKRRAEELTFDWGKKIFDLLNTDN